MKILRGLYGLSQAGRLTNQLLKKCLEEYIFYEVTYTLGLFTHKTRPVLVHPVG